MKAAALHWNIKSGRNMYRWLSLRAVNGVADPVRKRTLKIETSIPVRYMHSLRDYLKYVDASLYHSEMAEYVRLIYGITYYFY